MLSQRFEARCHQARRAGFSIIEAVIVLLIVIVVVASLTPTMFRVLTHARINRAANAVAADLYLAQALAGRQHAPVRVVVSPSARTLTIRSRGDSVLNRRYYGSEGEFKIQIFTATPDSVVVLPNGMANASMTVTLQDSAQTFLRQVKMTLAGQIRVQPH